MSKFAKTSEGPGIPVHFASRDTWPAIRDALAPVAAKFAAATGFEPLPGRHLLCPDETGAPCAVIFGLESAAARHPDPFLPGRLATLLPPGVYRFENAPHGDAQGLTNAALAFLLQSYRFTAYKTAKAELPRLLTPKGVDARRIERIATSVALARDLVNTPANDMGPQALEDAALALAHKYKAKANVIRGDKLLDANFPLIHAVGRASAEAPRLVDFSWGPAKGLKVTLIGKGVCFDTGGLDIKPDAAMLLMKKDMAGAATALALACMVMDAKLPVRLRVLLPIVENAIAGNAFRPGDIYRSRKGHTVEIGNTDAEGRLILADALALADEDAPDLMFDFATLTGAARVALGPDLPPFYTMDDGLAADVSTHGRNANDPVWRMPLWDPYDSMIDGKISTLNNIASGGFAGSIIAALFLRRFVEKTTSWAHFDMYGWNPSTKSGRPEGGETQCARLLYDLIEARASK